MKKQAKDLRVGDRFTYVGAFTIYKATSTPVLPDDSTGFVRFQVVNLNWGPERDHTPIDIQLRMCSEVVIFKRSQPWEDEQREFLDAQHRAGNFTWSPRCEAWYTIEAKQETVECILPAHHEGPHDAGFAVGPYESRPEGWR